MAKPLDMTHPYLDGRECFYLRYKRMGRGGTLKKVSGHLMGKGIYNVETGKSFNTSAVHMAMWRWAVRNLEEAKPIFKNFILSYGDIEWNENLWKKLVARRVKAYLTRAQAREFFERNPEYE